MTSNELTKVENPALEQLQSLGWSYIDGAELSPEESDERGSFKEVVLEKRLARSIRHINPWISDDNLHKVVRDLTKISYANLVETNKAIWTLINQCHSVMQDWGKGNKRQTVHIIDFENINNNEFLCVNQFKVAGLRQNIIPDIVLFVNGLPLAVIECKSPFVTDPMAAGIDQLLRYANRRNPADNEGAERLFYYNLLLVATCWNKARVGAITSRPEYFLEWKDPYPITLKQPSSPPASEAANDEIASLSRAAEQQPPDYQRWLASSQGILIAGLFSRANLLDIMQNFTVFEAVDGRTIKKIPRYQQFRAVHKTIKRIKSGHNREEKSGVIWHTQGSGKSLTMVFLSLKMRRDPVLRDYKLVFLTDRIQLDNQLNSTFSNTQDETIYSAKSVRELQHLLAQDSSDIVTAMVQKFQDNIDGVNFPVLNESEKIIVLADEAHRSQYGILGAAMNRALPNAPRIAFTGTPLIRSQKTANTFGPYIDTYTIEQAFKDGATVQILYEGREPQVEIAGASLDSLFNEYFADYSDDQKAKIKRKYGIEKCVLEAPQRIRRICMDIVKHYREYIEPNAFKAMIVTSSRYAAITYKEQLDELGNAPQSAVIISGDHNDGQRFRQYTDGNRHKQQIEDFKKPLGTAEGQSQLSFLIVNDMLLTGFDAPIAQVMYLDRKLTDHNLLQAIARVNRTSRNKLKGYIIDYYGLSDYLTEALSMFATDDVQGALVALKEELPKLKNMHTRVLGHFTGLDLDDLDTCVLAFIDETKRQNFHNDFRTFARQLDIILPDPAAIPFLHDLKRLGRIAIAARNHYRDDELDIKDAGGKVRKLIDEHVHSTGIDPKIPPIDLLAGNYKEQLNRHKSPRARASEIENAIKQHIKVNLDEDPEYYKKLSERLARIISEHKEKWKELEQQLLNFRENIISDYQQQTANLGLSATEVPFYNILIAELEDVQGADTVPVEKVKEVVQHIVAMLEQETQIVDFWQKSDEQKRIRREIKRLVIGHFEDALVKSVTARFMELAETKFK